VRGLVGGLVVIVAMSLSVLSLRPGGLRRQLRLVARRFRITLLLAGAWTFGSLILRLAYPTGPVSDYGPAALGLVLGAVFVFVARDPAPEKTSAGPGPGRRP
jgi:hypothetical protein